jgi:hypothetical protein
MLIAQDVIIIDNDISGLILNVYCDILTVSNNSKLEFIQFENARANVIHINGNDNLKLITGYIEFNDNSALFLSNNEKLTTINVYNYNIMADEISINIYNNTNLQNVIIDSSQFSLVTFLNVNICNNIKLTNLSVDFSSTYYLDTFKVYNTSLDQIDLLFVNNIKELYITENSNLSTIRMPLLTLVGQGHINYNPNLTQIILPDLVNSLEMCNNLKIANFNCTTSASSTISSSSSSTSTSVSSLTSVSPSTSTTTLSPLPKTDASSRDSVDYHDIHATYNMSVVTLCINLFIVLFFLIFICKRVCNKYRSNEFARFNEVKDAVLLNESDPTVDMKI